MNVRYTERWNELTCEPVDGFGWLEPATAFDIAKRGQLVEAVDFAQTSADGSPAPRWVISFRIPGRVRVSLLNEQASVWRQVDWDLVEGRLWRWITRDYTYGESSRRQQKSESVFTAKTHITPDGAGRIDLLERQSHRKARHQFTGRAFSSYWLDFPEFGDWGALATPGPSAYEVAGLDAAGPDALALIEQGDA